MQYLLDDFLNNEEFMFAEMVSEFACLDGGKYDILQLKELLGICKQNSNRIKLHAGFLPYHYANAIGRGSKSVL